MNSRRFLVYFAIIASKSALAVNVTNETTTMAPFYITTPIGNWTNSTAKASQNSSRIFETDKPNIRFMTIANDLVSLPDKPPVYSISTRDRFELRASEFRRLPGLYDLRPGNNGSLQFNGTAKQYAMTLVTADKDWRIELSFVDHLCSPDSNDRKPANRWADGCFMQLLDGYTFDAYDMQKMNKSQASATAVLVSTSSLRNNEDKSCHKGSKISSTNTVSVVLTVAPECRFFAPEYSANLSSPRDTVLLYNFTVIFVATNKTAPITIEVAQGFDKAVYASFAVLVVVFVLIAILARMFCCDTDCPCFEVPSEGQVMRGGCCYSVSKCCYACCNCCEKPGGFDGGTRGFHPESNHRVPMDAAMPATHSAVTQEPYMTNSNGVANGYTKPIGRVGQPANRRTSLGLVLEPIGPQFITDIGTVNPIFEENEVEHEGDGPMSMARRYSNVDGTDPYAAQPGYRAAALRRPSNANHMSPPPQTAGTVFFDSQTVSTQPCPRYVAHHHLTPDANNSHYQ